MQEMLMVRDGTPGVVYVGRCDMSYNDICEGMINGTLRAIELQGVYTLNSFMVAVGPGKFAQEMNIFPIDGELDNIKSVMIVPTAVYPLSSEGTLRIARMIEVCENNLTRIRSGLITNVTSLHGGKISG